LCSPRHGAARRGRRLSRRCRSNSGLLTCKGRAAHGARSRPWGRASAGSAAASLARATAHDEAPGLEGQANPRRRVGCRNSSSSSWPSTRAVAAARASRGSAKSCVLRAKSGRRPMVGGPAAKISRPAPGLIARDESPAASRSGSGSRKRLAPRWRGGARGTKRGDAVQGPGLDEATHSPRRRSPFSEAADIGGPWPVRSRRNSGWG